MFTWAPVTDETLTWLERAARVRAGEVELADAEVVEPIDSYRRLFRALLRNSFDSVVLCHRDGEYVAVSDSFCALTGYTRAELLGRTSIELGMVDRSGARRAAERDVAAGRPGLYENVITSKTGQTRHVEFSHQLLDDDYQLVIVRDVTDQRRETRLLSQLASTDPLTGLLNRRGFEAVATGMLADSSAPAHVILLDVDALVQINARVGHAGGDEILRVVGRAVLDVVATTGIPSVVGRLGGDGFTVLLVGVDADRARAVSDEVVGQLSDTAEPRLWGAPIQVSAGLATRGRPEQTIGELIADADIDLVSGRSGR